MLWSPEFQSKSLIKAGLGGWFVVKEGIGVDFALAILLVYFGSFLYLNLALKMEKIEIFLSFNL